MNKVQMRLEGLDGNAFHLLSAFAVNAKRQGWSQQAIDAVNAEATNDDYDHLLSTLMEHTERPEESDI
jgi:hypothetical protein